MTAAALKDVLAQALAVSVVSYVNAEILMVPRPGTANSDCPRNLPFSIRNGLRPSEAAGRKLALKPRSSGSESSGVGGSSPVRILSEEPAPGPAWERRSHRGWDAGLPAKYTWCRQRSRRSPGA